jgi:hypothetical protein
MQLCDPCNPPLLAIRGNRRRSILWQSSPWEGVILDIQSNNNWSESHVVYLISSCSVHPLGLRWEPWQMRPRFAWGLKSTANLPSLIIALSLIFPVKPILPYNILIYFPRPLSWTIGCIFLLRLRFEIQLCDICFDGSNALLFLTCFPDA